MLLHPEDRMAALAMLVAAGNPVEVVANAAGLTPDVLSPLLAPHWNHHRSRLAFRRLVQRIDRRPTSGCWLVVRGTVSRDGRPQARSGPLGVSSAAQMTLLTTSGWQRWPQGLVARHRCHEPRCASPWCLVPGSVAENNRDRRRLRQGVEIEPRTATSLVNLDAAELPYERLKVLADIERALSRLRPAVTGPEGCLLPRGKSVEIVGSGGAYRRVQIGGRAAALHRLVLELVGPLPAGMEALHSCDRMACAAVACLSAGTSSRNRLEAVERGWLKSGAAHPRARLTEAQVIAARRRIRAGMSDQATEAARCDVSLDLLRRALIGETYRDVEEPTVGARRRRLSDGGVRVIRTLARVGVERSWLVSATGHRESYVADLVAGRIRADAGGRPSRHPGKARGTSVTNAKLNDHAVLSIRCAVSSGQSCAAVARLHGVSATTVERIVAGTTWRHVRPGSVA